MFSTLNVNDFKYFSKTILIGTKETYLAPFLKFKMGKKKIKGDC
jgi:hypothetical protein